MFGCEIAVHCDYVLQILLVGARYQTHLVVAVLQKRQ